MVCKFIDFQLSIINYQWYVMLHRNPQQLDQQLQRVNMLRRQQESPRVRQLDYFIPFCFLSRVPADADVKDLESIAEANQLRDDFHDFAFIRALPADIAELTDSDWNRNMHHHLHHYRDFQKREVTICDQEMQTLIRIFSERRIKFFVGLPEPEIFPEERVYIMEEGAFQGQLARVIAVKHTAEGISLTLGIRMFSDTKEVKIPGISLKSIQTERVPDDIIGQQFVQEAEWSILGILSRRVNHKETDESNADDVVLLNHLFLYSYITIHDSDLSARFLALMLICASLRYDESSTQSLTERVRKLLGGTQELSTIHYSLSTEIRSYLLFALYVATRDADYRTQAKSLLQTIPDPSSALRRLKSLTSRLRGKRK